MPVAMKESAVERLRHWVWQAGVTCVASGLVLRDRMLGRLRRVTGLHPTSRHLILSGGRVLDAVLVQPPLEVEVRGALLICHGIGETVDHWTRPQNLLASHGIVSLVFNYSGCGRSTGWIGVERCERDAIAAFRWLRETVPNVPITLLGFSLGTGVAAAVAPLLPIARLILCEGYTSFRDAVAAAGLPRWIATALVPDVWRSVDALKLCRVPVLVVHGDRDRLFPVAMGRSLADAADERGELAVVAGMGHSDLHSKASMEHWRPILAPTASDSNLAT
jgi:pimeloyl-ACP methyl ester carboxylesterase